MKRLSFLVPDTMQFWSAVTILMAVQSKKLEPENPYSSLIVLVYLSSTTVSEHVQSLRE